MPNFRPIRARIRVLWWILRSVRNEVEEKNEEIKMKFCSLVSRKWPERFSLHLVCGLPLLAGISLANLVPIGLDITELHRCENCVFFLPVNILTVWRAGFLGRTTHFDRTVSYLIILLELLTVLLEYIDLFV